MKDIACIEGAWKKWAREGDTRDSLARARSLLRPVLPSACYPGYEGYKPC